MNNELYHHGIKGMKWGIRRTPAQLGHPTSSGSSQSVRRQTTNTPRTSKVKNYTTRNKQPKEDISQLSDKELRQRINRLQMERQYAQLTQPEINGGKKFVKDVLTNAARQTATQYAAKYMSKAVESAINSATKDK